LTVAGSDLSLEAVVYVAGAPDLAGVAVPPVKIGHEFVLFAVPSLAEAVELARALAPGARGVGVSAGDVLVEGGDRFGTPVVEAARLASIAGLGEVLAIDLVVEASAGGWVPLGPVTLKGLERPLEVYRSAGE
jgi:class 3 adenylate cyclase